MIGLAQRNICYNFSSSLLCVLLTSLGTAIFCLVLLVAKQVDRQLRINGEHIDLVVGAKGSPLQLILNSIYHVDYPTGNILLKDAQGIAKNPLVKLAVPLSMGDNYQGYRIIGTDSNFLSLYASKIAVGRWVKADFEAVIGAQIAAKRQLRIGDKIIGAHGLSHHADLHEDHPYTISGILRESNNITDQLVLTNLSSIWHMHEEHDDHKPMETTGEVKSLIETGHQEKEITSLLIQYKNPAAVALFPRMINQNTNMQAASPSIESARLFSMMGIGMDTLNILASLLMLLAAVSVFISLYNAFQNRKYELAVMRAMGASRAKLFWLMLIEGWYITLLGTGLGILMAHAFVGVMNQVGHQNILSPWTLYKEEIQVVWIGSLIGIGASLVPGIKAYLTPISTTLSQ